MLIPGTMIGARHVILPRSDPAAVLDTLESERITMFFGVPAMYQFLLRLPDLANRDLSCWRTGLFGAAPMPASAVERLVTTLPQVNFIQLGHPAQSAGQGPQAQAARGGGQAASHGKLTGKRVSPRGRP
jgi:fatty-acyl-CoA synthase